MELPSIPSDNLYKFAALAGLALIAFSLTYLSSKSYELQIAEIETNAQIERIKIDLQHLKKNMDDLKKDISEMTENRMQATEKKLSTTYTQLIEYGHKEVDVIALQNKTELQKIWFKKYLDAGFYVFMLGSFATVYGFGFWYIRVQKPQDKKLKKESAQ